MNSGAKQMRSNDGRFNVKPSVVAVRCALLALAFAPAAYAADPPDAADPGASTVTVGAGYVNKDSAKFGEYNGLDQKGAFAIIDFNLRGGSADEATRWKITGTDLGLDTRAVKAEFGQQGRFRIDAGYDSIIKNRSDTYQTPYLGVGGND